MPKIQDFSTNETRKQRTTFSQEVVNHFREELNRIGNFYQFLIKKDAMVVRGNNRLVRCWSNREAYKRKYLIGVYAPLQSHLTTDIPMDLWKRVYQQLEQP